MSRLMHMSRLRVTFKETFLEDNSWNELEKSCPSGTMKPKAEETRPEMHKLFPF